MYKHLAHWLQTIPCSLDTYFDDLGSWHFQNVIILKQTGSWSRKHSLTLKKHLQSNSVSADFLSSFSEEERRD